MFGISSCSMLADPLSSPPDPVVGELSRSIQAENALLSRYKSAFVGGARLPDAQDLALTRFVKHPSIPCAASLFLFNRGRLTEHFASCDLNFEDQHTRDEVQILSEEYGVRHSPDIIRSLPERLLQEKISETKEKPRNYGAGAVLSANASRLRIESIVQGKLSKATMSEVIRRLPSEHSARVVYRDGTPETAASFKCAPDMTAEFIRLLGLMAFACGEAPTSKEKLELYKNLSAMLISRPGDDASYNGSPFQFFLSQNSLSSGMNDEVVHQVLMLVHKLSRFLRLDLLAHSDIWKGLQPDVLANDDLRFSGLIALVASIEGAGGGDLPWLQARAVLAASNAIRCNLAVWSREKQKALIDRLVSLTEGIDEHGVIAQLLDFIGKEPWSVLCGLYESAKSGADVNMMCEIGEIGERINMLFAHIDRSPRLGFARMRAPSRSPWRTGT